MLKKTLLSLMLLNYYTNQASESGKASPVKQEVVYFSICQSTGTAAHASCVLRTQCSQRCIGCRKWDMLFSESKEACLEFKVDLASNCPICEKILVADLTLTAKK